MSPTRLTLFDLDHTLLDGDSDVLWCEFLMRRGVLDRAEFEPRNRRMARDYQAGTVGPQAFTEFYVAILRGRDAAQWEPLRREFVAKVIVPSIGPAARALVARHREAGDLLVLTTATNRFMSELSAEHLGFEHLIATECAFDEAGRFTGATTGTLNMREGKVDRLRDWLAGRGLALDSVDSTAYSDSMNDLALLEAVRHPVAVNPDARLAALAAERGWPVMHLHIDP